MIEHILTADNNDCMAIALNIAAVREFKPVSDKRPNAKQECVVVVSLS